MCRSKFHNIQKQNKQNKYINTRISPHPTGEMYHFSSEHLIRSCPLPKSMFSHKSADNLTIKSSKFEPLSSLLKRNKKHLEYSIMEKMIESIGRQLHHLEMENKGISSFNLDDITVFYTDPASTATATDATATATATDATATDATATATATATIHFAITNDDKIHDIDDEQQLIIATPYHKEYTATAATTKNIAFHSPEFKEFVDKKTIPYKLHFKSGYYSFGLLCLYCYVSRNAATATATATATAALEQVLAPIVNTKIYWFFKWVLQEHPSERRYICV